MTDVVPEQRPVDLDELVGDEPIGTDGLDVVDEQLLPAWPSGPAREVCS